MTYEEKKNIVIDNCFQQDCDINTTIKEAYTKGFNRGADKQRFVVESKQNKIRAEINGMYRVIFKDTPKDDLAVKWNQCLDEVLQIIGKYKSES